MFASLKVLLEIQAQTYAKMRSVEVGEERRRKAKVCRRVNRKITAWQEVVDGKRGVMSYLKLVGYMCKSRGKK